MVSKRKLTTVCSHDASIGNVGAHLFKLVDACYGAKNIIRRTPQIIFK